MLIAIINLPGVISLLGLMLAVGASFLSYQKYFSAALICFIYAGIADLFDGVVARKCALNSPGQRFGVQLDSLIDAVSFGITPVILLLHLGYHSLVDFIVFSIFTCCAVLRLAYFNCMKEDNHDLDYYLGLPVTYAALIVPLLLIALSFIPSGFKDAAVRGTVLVVSLLFILKIKIPKPGGVFYIIFPVLAVGLTVYLCLFDVAAGGRQ